MKSVLGCAIACMFGFAPFVRAQLPRGFDTLSARAVADSLKVIDSLNAHIRRNSKDVDALHRRGMIAWALGMRLRHPAAPRMPSAVSLRRTADQSLFAALSLDRVNGRRWLTMGYFYRTDPINAAAQAAKDAFHRTIALAEAGGDSLAGARAALQLAGYLGSDFGMSGSLPAPPDIVPFAREAPAPQNTPGRAASGAAPPPPFTPRPPPRNPLSRSRDGPPPAVSQRQPEPPMERSRWVLDGAETGCIARTVRTHASRSVAEIMEIAIDSIRRFLDLAKFEDAQQANYLTAQYYAAVAHALAPLDTHAFRGLASVLLVRGEWADLNTLASERTRLVPADPWGWMLKGLALHRHDESRGARTAFDSGMARLTPADRATLDRLDRVLTTRDSAAFVRADSAVRERNARTAWLLADPLWSETEEDPRLEFLARLTFAEIRWGRVDTVGVGASSPMGAIFVRYGPADEARGGFWIYRNGLVLSRAMYASGGRACGPGEVGILNRVKAELPAHWDNAARVTLDSMPTQVARFRAERDSVDVFLAARVPVDRIQSGVATREAIQTKMWLYAWTRPDAFEPKVSADSSGVIRWHGRLAPDSYYYRLESTIPGALVAGRTAATAVFGPDSATGFSLRGFGISDVLVASSVMVSGTPSRWSDIMFTPLAGDAAHGSEISLVWETYELAERDRSADYAVTITIERQRTDSGRIAARVVRGVAPDAGVTSSDSTMTIEYSRRTPYAPVIVDNVVVALAETPAGSYRLTVTLRDVVTGRSVSRSTRFVIRTP